MNCPECGEAVEYNICIGGCGYERDPVDDCDQRLDQARDDAMFEDERPKFEEN